MKTCMEDLENKERRSLQDKRITQCQEHQMRLNQHKHLELKGINQMQLNKQVVLIALNMHLLE